MQVQLYMHILEVPWEKDRQADSAQWRIAPFRLRYQGDEKAQSSRRVSQGRARVCLIITLLLVIRLLMQRKCAWMKCFSWLYALQTTVIADSAQGRSAPYRLRYQGDEKAHWSKRGSQGRARVCLIIILLLVIRLLSIDHNSVAQRLLFTSIPPIKTSQTTSKRS